MENSSGETRSRLELADILRRFGPSYAQTHSVSPVEQRIIDDLMACRTARLGGHIEHCAQGGFERQAYNSCLMGRIHLWGFNSFDFFIYRPERLFDAT